MGLSRLSLATDKYVPGVYAVKVFGKLPDEVIEELTERGYTYHRREYVPLPPASSLTSSLIACPWN